MSNEIQRPRNCGECARFWRDTSAPGRGYCDNWAGIHLRETDVCNPNFGVKSEVPRKEGGAE